MLTMLTILTICSICSQYAHNIRILHTRLRHFFLDGLLSAQLAAPRGGYPQIEQLLGLVVGSTNEACEARKLAAG